MKYLYSFFITLFISTAYAQVYQPASYHYNGTPTNGVKIKTNLPFSPGNTMPTIILEGYNYGTGDAVGIMINYYVYSTTGTTGDPANYYFVKHNATSYGGYTPTIKLANENNKIVIFLDSKDYYLRFMVRAFAKGLSEQSTWFDGWTIVDEALPAPAVAAHQVTVPYRNRFKNEVYLDGNLSIGTVPPSSNITITRPLSSTNSVSVNNYSTIKKGSTSVIYFNSAAYTEADTFTVGSVIHYSVNQGTPGAGSSITNQYGFFVNSTFTNATNTYGFYGLVPNGTSKWNLYMAGTANNYLAGSLTIGSTTISSTSLKVSKAISETNLVGIRSDGQVQTNVTDAYYFRSDANKLAGASSTNSITHYLANQSTISSVTSQMGFSAGSSLIGATNNYGFFGNIGASTGRWNLYMGGTADNYLAGNVGIGITTPTARLEVRNPANGGVSQTNPLISARGLGNNYEFGHTNALGYASTLGALNNGKPFLCFNCEAGTTNNTFRTRGLFGTVITTDLAGGLIFGRTAANNADNQDLTTDLVLKGGQLGIGTTAIPAGYKLAIAGNVIAEKIKVKKQVNGVWPDFVFSPDYKLPSLEEIEQFTKKNSHLPEIPSAKEIEKDGQDLGEMNRLLLKKIEELTLYVIEQNKRIEALEKKNK